ncbi:hypothetical protein BDN72DRAFT_819566 [Pluteus cervinus]|uniref:Uncharacterized protein n=1 Tax=Pluteus cervinus TaxID=181527 RepID=A0ACD3AWW5_9AGAR|nr:hypothetical protein BDN72DRAFT_819566 [Pluteus cervinus]
MTRNVQLLTLPTEILGIILGLCALNDLTELRQVCRAINSLAEPLIFSTLTINTHSWMDYAANQVKSLAEGETHASLYARRLVVGSVDHRFPYVHSKFDSEIQYILHMKKYLAPALASLKNVRSVRWIPQPPESDWVMDVVSRFIPQLSLLEKLEVEAYWAMVPPLPDLPNLQTLSLKIGSNNLTDFAAAMKSATKLTSLTIDCCGVVDWEKKADLNEIFETFTEPRQLRGLNLSDCSIHLSEGVVQHVRSLRSLKLKDDQHGEPSDLEENRDEDWQLADEEEERVPAPVLVDRIKQIRPKSTAFWSTLQRESVKLEELDIDKVDHALFDYLGSYTGLRDLHLPNIDAVRRVLVDHLADYFYTWAFPKHVATLERLCLVSAYTSTWCFGPKNSFLFFQCQKLRQLQIGWDAEDVDAKKNLFGILDLSAALPLLDELTISYSFNRSIRGRNRVSLRSYRMGIYDKLARSALPKYGPIDTKKHLRYILVHRLKWELFCRGGVWRYRYVGIKGPHLTLVRTAEKSEDEDDEDGDQVQDKQADGDGDIVKASSPV